MNFTFFRSEHRLPRPLVVPLIDYFSFLYFPSFIPRMDGRREGFFSGSAVAKLARWRTGLAAVPQEKLVVGLVLQHWPRGLRVVLRQPMVHPT